MSRSMQFHCVFIAQFIKELTQQDGRITKRSRVRLEMHNLTGPELPIFLKRKGILKIDQSVKMPKTRNCMLLLIGSWCGLVLIYDDSCNQVGVVMLLS